jgi:hypothetical protein
MNLETQQDCWTQRSKRANSHTWPLDDDDDGELDKMWKERVVASPVSAWRTAYVRTEMWTRDLQNSKRGSQIIIIHSKIYAFQVLIRWDFE